MKPSTWEKAETLNALNLCQRMSKLKTKWITLGHDIKRSLKVKSGWLKVGLANYAGSLPSMTERF